MIQIEDIAGKSGALCEGARFQAEDKLGRKYKYRYEGTEKTSNGYDIHLHNLTNGTETYVEKRVVSPEKSKLYKGENEHGKRKR